MRLKSLISSNSKENNILKDGEIVCVCAHTYTYIYTVTYTYTFETAEFLKYFYQK